MEAEEVIKGNELIAKFLGWTYKMGKFWTQDSNSSGEYYDHVIEDEIWWNENDYPEEQGLLFHRDWNYLMPVVDKINAMDYAVTIYRGCVDIAGKTDTGWKEIVEINLTDEITLRDMIWYAVVEFLEYYNKLEEAI